jgi:hypothetical protein
VEENPKCQRSKRPKDAAFDFVNAWFVLNGLFLAFADLAFGIS